MELQGVIAQLIGIIVFGMGVYAVSQKCDGNFKKFITAQAYLLSLHFLLLGAMAGFAVAFVVGTRNLLSLKFDLKNFAPLFIAIFLGVGYMNYESFTDIMPVASSILATLGLSYLSGYKLRMIFITGSSLWAIYNLTNGAFGPAFMEMFMIGVGIRTVYMLLKDRAENAQGAALPQAAE